MAEDLFSAHDRKPPAPKSVRVEESLELGLPAETPSGVHRAIGAIASEAVKHDVNVRTLVIAAFALLVGLGSLWTGQNLFIDAARAAGKEAADSGVAKVAGEVEALKLELKATNQRLDGVEQGQKEVKADVHEIALDVRAQYRSSQTGLPSPRLEKPPAPVDGGR